MKPPTLRPQHAYALPLPVWAASIGLPADTLDALRRKGKGPAWFLIGRRIYCREDDWHQWLDDVAAGRIDATLRPSKRRHRAG